MMAIEISEDPATGHLLVTFTIPDDGDDTTVSVVGSFNCWLPGTDTFTSRGDGLQTVAVTLIADDDVHFRYLRTGGVWFDDDEADEITSFGSVITSPHHRLSSSMPAFENESQSVSDDDPTGDAAEPSTTPSPNTSSATPSKAPTAVG
jgi:hypothetical protein